MNTKTTFENPDDSHNHEDRLLALKKEFQDILDITTEEEKLEIGGKFLDDLWDEIYIKHFPYQSVTIGDGSRVVKILPKRVIKNTSGRPSTTNFDYTNLSTLDKNVERLALVKYHNCAFKPLPGEDVFHQALRTAAMKYSVLMGEYKDWAYLKDTPVEPVTYNIPHKNTSRIFSKAWCKNLLNKIHRVLFNKLFKNDLRAKIIQEKEKTCIEFLKSCKGQV